MEHELLELWSSVEKDKDARREAAAAAHLTRQQRRSAHKRSRAKQVSPEGTAAAGQPAPRPCRSALQCACAAAHLDQRRAAHKRSRDKQPSLEPAVARALHCKGAGASVPVLPSLQLPDCLLGLPAGRRGGGGGAC